MGIHRQFNGVFGTFAKQEQYAFMCDPYTPLKHTECRVDVRSGAAAQISSVNGPLFELENKKNPDPEADGVQEPVLSTRAEPRVRVVDELVDEPGLENTDAGLENTDAYGWAEKEALHPEVHVHTSSQVHVHRCSHVSLFEMCPERETIEERLANRGAGRSLVEGSLAVSAKWDHTSKRRNELDLWVTAPSGQKICSMCKQSVCGGEFDVTSSQNDENPLENVVWKANAPRGDYKIEVHKSYQDSADDVEDPVSCEVMIVKDGGVPQKFNVSVPAREGSIVLVTTVKNGDLDK